MVNFSDPTIVIQDAFAMSNLWHTVAGLYFWEFFATLDYEWSIIQRRRPYPWTIWVYFTTRMATLLAVVLALVSDYVKTRYNCEVQAVFELIFGYTAVAAASLLIVLRIIAIWSKNKIIVAIASGVWVINVVSQIQAIVRLRSIWITGADACVTTNFLITRLNILVSLGTDSILLLIMFFGLLRLGFHERSALGLGRLLWKQGVIWLLAATIAELLPAVFMFLNLNEPFDFMFLLPAMITLSIAATRMYRSLAHYASIAGTERLCDPISQGSGHLEWKEANTILTTPTLLSRMPMEVITNSTAHDQLQPC